MPKKIKVYSSNDVFQKIEVLKRNRRKRHQQQTFFVEGVKPINLVLSENWHIVGFAYDMEKELSDWAKSILRESNAQFHYELAPHLMEELSDKEETSELLALVSMPQNDIRHIPVRDNLLVIVLDRPGNPGNLGTIIRTADAFGASGLIVMGHSADLYDPRTIRASVGTIFKLPSIRLESRSELVSWLDTIKSRFENLQIVGSSAKAKTNIEKMDFKKPTVLVLGNETHGMSHGFWEVCDHVFKIPIHGFASSLNLSCASAISLYEIYRQRNKS